MIIDDFYFSIANKKANEAITDLVESLFKEPTCPKSENKVLGYILDCASLGAYPSKQYFSDLGYEATNTTKSASELALKAAHIIDAWRYESLRSTLFTAANSTTSFEVLKDKVSNLVEQVEDSSEDYDLDAYDNTIDFKVEKKANGFMLNISEIDTVTGGFQPGTVATLAAFTGHGKSTLAISAIYKNLKLGKSGVLASFEVTPKLALKQFYSRWLYEEKHLEISAKSMTDGSLDESQAKLVEQYQDEFNEFIKGKLFVVDEAILNKERLSDFKKLKRLFRNLETKVDSLDFIVYDHINQIDLIFKDMGNIFIRTLTSAGKTYVNKKGINPVSIMCMQCNRDGMKRAARREGKYDLIALSDLNEGERSSFYCVFLYTSDDMKILQETKVSMQKHRLGAVVTEPVSVTFNPGVFVVGETVDTVEYTGNLDFLNDGSAEFNADDFDDF